MSDHSEDRAGTGPAADDDEAPDQLAETTNPVDNADNGDNENNSHDADGDGASDVSTSGPNAAGELDGEDGEAGDDTNAASKQNAEDLRDMIASNDVKNIILQVMSPYLDDNGGLDDGDDGDDGGDGARLDADGHVDTSGEGNALRYDHAKSRMWIQLICDGITERLVAFGKPYKFIVHCMVMRKNGAGMHVCSSCLYGHNDGWVNHAHDLSTQIYAVVTVFWSAI